MNNPTKYYISFLLLLIVSAGCVTFFFYIEGMIRYAVLMTIVDVVLFLYVLKYFSDLFQDMQDFTEAVRYKDFSRRYRERKYFQKPSFRRNFNELNKAFLSINQEKEAQQQYLIRILELVDTGILVYDIETNNVLCINEALTSILNIPRVKNVRWIERLNQPLYEQLTALTAGDRKLIPLRIGQQIIKTLVNKSLFSTGNQTFCLIAFHNINTTLEDIESGAWKGLLRVMTHEIMNSIVPVSSLADTLKKQIAHVKDDSHTPSREDFQDIEDGMEAIKRRSEGLLRFAETYRTLSKTIVPEITVTDVNNLLVNIYQLMQPSLRQKGIVLETIIHDSIPPLSIDRKLIEQLIVNFIINARDAVQETKNPHIILSAGQNQEGETFLTVADNGKGIAPELMEKIFIPFFSTKMNGNGIGLSLSRQIIKAHNALLKIQTKENEGTAFTVLFKNE